MKEDYLLPIALIFALMLTFLGVVTFKTENRLFKEENARLKAQNIELTLKLNRMCNE